MANYTKTTTYSVSVSLEALERHLSNQLRNVLYQELHIDSLTKAYVLVNALDGITFYTVETVK